MTLFLRIFKKGITPPGGMVYTDPDGTQYAIWRSAFDAPVNRPLTTLVQLSEVSADTLRMGDETIAASDLLRFDSEAELVAWIVNDSLVREGTTIH